MKRPVVVTILGWLFILVGSIGFFYHFGEMDWNDPFANDAVWILLVRLAAILGGYLLLRSSNPGRWLLVLWMLYHIVISYFHSFSELLFHVCIFGAIAFALFHPRVNSYFRNS